MLGNVVCGCIVDRYHIYKKATIGTAVGAFICQIIHIFTVDMQFLISNYIMLALYGLFSDSYVIASSQLALEIAYPESETIVFAVFYALANPFILIFTSVGQALIDMVTYTKNITVFFNFLKSDKKKWQMVLYPLKEKTTI